MDDSNPKPTRKNLAKGIFLLPNLFTTGALFAGFYAIIAAMKGHYDTAAIAIFVAMLLDGLDGRVARMTNTQSAFGAEYDSLSDMVSFGVAPALIMYEWSLANLADVSILWGKLGWLAAFIYTTCTALRLARFNTQVGVADKRYFQGLACPAGAAVVMSAVWVCENYGISSDDVIYAAFVLTLMVGMLMVSKFPYYSFKDLDMRQKVPFVAVLMVMLVFVFLSIEPSTFLFSTSILYMLSGPIFSLFRWNRNRHRLAVSGEQIPTEKKD
jgi:CDP-diacylglycerol--serine O-phosphatidyltransferase